MYVPIVLLMFVALLVGGHAFLSWLLVETREDRDTTEERERVRRQRSFYNHRTWAAFRRLISKKPALLTYRRDKHGRFRKLNPAPPKPKMPASRSRKPRASQRRRPASARRKVHVPAE
jgi:hypothetical protein